MRVTCVLLYIVLLHRPLHAWYLLFHLKSTIQRLFCQTNEFARNVLYTNSIFGVFTSVEAFRYIYLQASTDVKIPTFFEKNEGQLEAVLCGSQKGPLNWYSLYPTNKLSAMACVLFVYIIFQLKTCNGIWKKTKGN